MKKGYSLSFDGDIVKAVVPRQLMQEVMRVASEEDVDFPSACKIVAERANSGTARFQKSVKDEAMRLYRSRHLTEMNKALYTKYNSGVEYGKSFAVIRFECSAHCGKLVEWDLSNETHRKQIYEILKAGGIANWKHGEH